MKKIIGLGIAVVFAGILTFFYFNRVKAPHSQVYEELERHHITDVSKLKGNYFILHFWAKWCEPCLEEIPEIVSFAAKAKFARPLTVLAVSLDPNLEIAREIFPNHGADLPANFVLALDAEHRFADSIGSYQYPESYLIGPSGEIVEKWVGPQKWNQPEVFDYFTRKLQ